MKPTRLCIATRNVHKVEEIRALIGDLGFEITSARDHPDCPEVDEDGATLAENAEKKARWAAASTGQLALADDTGLEVEALGGAPGVYSARYAGPECSFADNIARLLRELHGVPERLRVARFRCVVAIAEPPDSESARPASAATTVAPPQRLDPERFASRVRSCRVSLHEGRLDGRILEAPRGHHGFGYDPVFWIPDLGRTLAELALEAKNEVSHRARALAEARRALQRLALGRALDASDRPG